jgi:hypothetical protein
MELNSIPRAGLVTPDNSRRPLDKSLAQNYRRVFGSRSQLDKSLLVLSTTVPYRSRPIWTKDDEGAPQSDASELRRDRGQVVFPTWTDH